MEYKPLPIGVENFEKMIKNGYYYVDKTLFIKELIDKKSEVNLFTRPRRFGKSLSLSMIQYFFEKTEKDNTHLFEGLNIMSAGDFYTSEMNKYPVINITFKGVEGTTFDRSLEIIESRLQREFRRHKYLLKSDKIDDIQKAFFSTILTSSAKYSEYSISLFFLTECLELHYGEKVIVLIDEYDVPIEKAYFNGYYNEMVDFIRTLFHEVFKTNNSLNFAVITGCLRVSKDSIFTGFNNSKIISITSDMYGEFFGFTEEEVLSGLKFYRLEHKIEEARSWYNGYIFGNTNVYNPWSIINYLQDAYENTDWLPLSYWVNTSSNSIIGELIEIADGDAKDEIEVLLHGGSIKKPIHEDIVYSEIKQDMENLWNFLFFTGYLKMAGRYFERNQKYFDLVIPNTEVHTIFERKIREWFKSKVKAFDLDKMYTAVFETDVQTFARELNILLADTISYFDSQENFYHGFLTGVFAHMEGYRVKSNRESGDGRGDIFLLPMNITDTAVILEIKSARTHNALEEKCMEALSQIEKMKYDQELRLDGYGNILKYGIAFFRKHCMVRG